ncbi:MAG TPA: hypothetical protein DEP00_07245 [Lachnospiraceae bacterium]|nr:hypothetical protein [Lachnospiraceae bacterium]
MADFLKNLIHNPDDKNDEVPTGAKKYYGLIIIVVILAACLVGIAIGKNVDEKTDQVLSSFQAPLYDHELPQDSILLDQECKKNTDGSVFACLILQTKLSQSDLETFYKDVDPQPAYEGQTASLKVIQVTDDSLTSVQKSDEYQKGAGDCWFIYMYSGK